MSRPPQPNKLSVSLEPHLIETLRPLVDAVPAPLSAELSPLLSEKTTSSTPTISYALLQSISRWARTEEAARALRSKNPPLDPLAYNIVSLLAGTRTSPDKKFPQLPHPSARSDIAARDVSDRRAIIAVLNALLSVICTGAATWWAAQRTGWRDEWVGGRPIAFGQCTLSNASNQIQKVLLSLLAATIVAISEVGLYIIWESRRKTRQPVRTKTDHVRLPGVSHADSRDVGVDTPSEPTRLDEGSSQTSTSIDPHQPSARIALRQRIGTTSESHSG
jgi:hypothetical protein